MADGDDIVQLLSSDGQSFRVTARVARLSEVVARRLEDFGTTAWRGIRHDECAQLVVNSDGAITHALTKSGAAPRAVRPLADNEMVERNTRRVRPRGATEKRVPRAELDEWLAMEEPDDVIELAEVAGRELERIIKWMVHHAENPTPPVSEEDESRTDNIVEFDREMLDALDKLSDEDADLLAAANYMHVQELIDTICRWEADIVKGKTPAEIYAMRGLRPEDMVDDERAVREEEGPWIERYYSGEPVPDAAAAPTAATTTTTVAEAMEVD